MFSRNLRVWLTMPLLIGGGVWLGLFGWSSLRTDSRLDQKNSVVEGKVIGSSTWTSTNKGQWYSLVVEYQPENHPAIKRKFDVGGDAYRAGLATGKATVTYLPEDPQISRVTRFAPVPYQVLMGLGGFMILGGLIGLGFFVKGHKGDPVTPR